MNHAMSSSVSHLTKIVTISAVSLLAIALVAVWKGKDKVVVSGKHAAGISRSKTKGLNRTDIKKHPVR